MDQEDVMAIWPGSGIPPGSEGWAWHEQTMQAPDTTIPNRMARNVVIPTLTMFKPAADTANGTAMIVAPGGAFHFLMMDHEGYDVAHWLTQFGVTAFVLKYRVQHTPETDADMPAFLQHLQEDLPHPGPTGTSPPVGTLGTEEARLWGEADGRQAIRYLRQHAAELEINPRRIGIMGFSAGGGIAVNAALEYDSLSRPDFVAGIYPGYRIVEAIPENLPPLFLAIADDDKAVAAISSARLYETWHKANKPIELHIFSNGGHGFGMLEQNQLSDAWTYLFKRWLASQGYLSLKGVESMEIKRVGSQPSGLGPADWFTGTVRIDPLFQVQEPARAAGNSVTFEPGARTAWHTHPLGQTLIVTAGCGLAQRWGGPIEVIRPGDVVWFPPGEKHWHGAAPTTAMTHIAIQESLDGKAVEWLEHVSDEQYQG